MDEFLKTMHELCEIYSESLTDAKNKLKKSGGPVSVGDAEYLDKLTHTVKSLRTTIDMMEAEGGEGGYSGRYMPRMGAYYGPGMSYNDGMSYADGERMGDGRGSSYARGRTNARRDSMGRYSREGGYSYAAEIDGIMDDLRGLMADMPADKQRTVERLMTELQR